MGNSGSVSVEEETSSRDWSFLDPIVIDHLVKNITQSGRWGLDGRSLRSLNRHWSSNINRHITAINPHISRQIIERDLYSLRKFPNITSVNLWSFLKIGLDHCHSVNQADQWWRAIPRAEKKERLMQVIEVLGSLPQLSELVISHQLFGIRTINRKGVSKFDEAFKKVTSIRVSDGYNLGTCRLSDLEFVAGLQILKVEGNEIAMDADETLDQFPSLREAKVRVETDSSPEFISMISRLESVRVKFLSRFSMRDLTELTQLEGLEFKIGEAEEVGCLNRLTGLRHLSIENDSGFQENLEQFKNLVLSISLSSLESLKLENKSSRCLKTPVGFFEKFPQLRNLSLKNFELAGGDMLKSLTRLVCLEMVFCCINDKPQLKLEICQGEVDRLKRLKVLRIIDPWIPWLVEEAAMEDLEALYVGYCGDHWATLVKSANCLPKLKTLGIEGQWHGSVFSELKKSKLFDRLDLLCLYGSDPLAAIEEIGELRRTTPNLKIQLSQSVGSTVYQEHFV